MTTVTLNEIKTEQTRLAQLIAAFEKATQQRLLMVAGAEIALDDGEHYAGAVLNEDGTLKHHLVLMAPKPDDTMTWQAARSWAASVGGDLPNRQESALLYANCKPHIEGVWHWTSDVYEPNESYAWVQHFGYGYQLYVRKDYDYAARAVRRVIG
jgi:hypothetical protein